MSSSQFSRPGAIDLSALKRPAAAAGGGAASGSGAYAVMLDEANFQQEMEGSLTAPVVLVFYSPAKSPASAHLAADLEALSEEFAGRFLLGKVDIDAAPQLAQMLQIPQVPLVALVMNGQLAPLLQDAPPIEQLRTVMTQVLEAAVQQGITGRHEPRTTASPEQDDEDRVDPRHLPAQDALAAGDFDRAVSEYEKLVGANPADAEASAGLAMARVLKRAEGADAQTARTAAADRPDDVAAQTLAADFDLLDGRVDEAFARLIDLIRRSSDDERDAARTHLLGLFAAVGNEDARVLKGRQNLASALF